MEPMIFLQDMAIVMAVSAVIIILCQRFHLPVVLGYILAGIVIGPHTPPYSLVTDLHSIHLLSEMGVIFLLFSIGLEFSFSRLGKVGLVAFVGATLEILLMICFGFALGRAFGWSEMDSLFLGAILSISSTTIIAKVLMETKRIKEQFAQVILGILIIEDLLAIVIIALLSGVASTGSLEIGAAGLAMTKVLAFIAGVLVVGILVVPRLLRYLERFDNPELTVITALGLCFGVSLLASKSGFSVALGAFLIGAIIAETRQAKAIVHQMEPIRDMFTAIFFVSVGMLIEPGVIAEHSLPIIVIAAVTVAGKVFSCSFATFLSGYKPETALMVGLGLAQIGEFSFIIADLGQTRGVTSGFLYPIAVSVSAITTLTTPFLMRSSDSIVTLLKKIVPNRLDAFLGLYTSWAQSLGRGAGRRSWAELLGASKVHARLEKMITDILGKGEEAKTTHDDLVKFIREQYPWDVETADFMVPFNESALNRRLSELRLRNETGATIVSIYRDEEAISNPGPDVALASGDVLLILGNKEQVRAALEFLQKKAREPLGA